jgi:hypothetical protein
MLKYQNPSVNRYFSITWTKETRSRGYKEYKTYYYINSDGSSSNSKKYENSIPLKNMPDANKVNG